MSNKVPQIRFNGYSDAWVQRNLAELATMNARIGWQNLRTSEFLDEGDYILITGTDFKDGEIDYSNIHYVEKERFDQDKKIQVQDGSILITKDGTLGKVAYVKNLPGPATLNAGVFNIRVINSDETDSKYLFHYLKAPFLLKFADEQSTGGTIKHLNQNVLVKFPVPLPGLDEQKRIANLLESMDNLIAANQRKLDLLKEQKKGYLKKMFPKNGAKVPELRFAGFADDWEERKLSDMANVKTGFPFKNENFVDDGQYLVITNGNIQNDSAFVDGKVGNRITAVTDEIKEKYTLNYGDILVTMDGTVGRTAKVVEGNQILAQRVGRLVSESTPEFIYQWLNTGKFFTEMTKVSHGGTIKHISLSEIGDYVAYVPTSKDEREKIGSLFLNIDKTITLHQRKLDLLKEQKKGFLQKMFV
ncbi:restriction endonuclease subunit S [Weissella cibaria]|uniref:restriction endonuclease subunit S n=1 Tax=Weissella cibaria TaxID=137591 RepID=UPI0015E874B2|nr:restriction endonuclease subunit S [Weissella cibaria]